MQTKIKVTEALSPDVFVIVESGKGDCLIRRILQCGNTIVAIICPSPDGRRVLLDAQLWDLDQRWGRFRNQFLCEKKPGTLKRIKTGEYLLTNLNE